MSNTASLQATLLKRDVPSAWWQQDGLSFPGHCFAFLIALVAIVSRRPDMFLHPQFYAEDGFAWYAQAYNTSWLHALLMPQAGYMQTFPRLVTALALQVPMRLAPLLMNGFGLVAQALPVTALLSHRCSPWGSLRLRVLLAALYVGIPNSAEIHVVTTNAQWHLVVLEMLLAFALPPQRWIGRVSDVVLFTIGAVSGPFSAMLFPLALFYGWRRRQRWTGVLAAILAAGAAWEVFTILHTVRYHVALGATPALLARIYGGEVLLNGVLAIKRLSLVLPTSVLAIVGLGGLLMTALGFLLGPLPFRLLIVFSALFFLTALRSPLVPIIPGESAWTVLSHDWECRYWFYPLLAFLWSAGFCVAQQQRPVARIAGFCVLVPLLGGVVHDWRYPPFSDYHFADQLQRIQQASPGERLVIPIYPPGWTMVLVRHAGS